MLSDSHEGQVCTTRFSQHLGNMRISDKCFACTNASSNSRSRHQTTNEHEDHLAETHLASSHEVFSGGGAWREIKLTTTLQRPDEVFGRDNLAEGHKSRNRRLETIDVCMDLNASSAMIRAVKDVTPRVKAQLASEAK